MTEMLRAISITLLAAFLCAACAEQSAMRLASDIVRVNVSTAPIYGALEPERRAMILAAQETVKNGYDRFIILDGASSFRPNQLGQAPGHASGSLTTGFTATGPSTVSMPRFETAITIKMFKNGDSAGQNAISAAEILRSTNG